MKTIPIWIEVRIKDWSHFEEECQKITNKRQRWIFRGQSSTHYDLTTSLYRAKYDCNRNIELYEQCMIDEFERVYHNYPGIRFNKPIDKSDLSQIREYRLNLLSVMQHFGAPTRLQDWTYSPYIALFFGLDGASTDDFCVYALDIDSLEKEYDEKNADLFRKHYHSSPWKSYLDFIFEPSTHAPFVCKWVPSMLNERIRVQQGLFLVPSLPQKSITNILSTYQVLSEQDHNNSIAIKFIFNREMIRDYWLKMSLLNLTHETIYPGLEGFCKSLKLVKYDQHKMDRANKLRYIDDPVIDWLFRDR